MLSFSYQKYHDIPLIAKSWLSRLQTRCVDDKLYMNWPEKRNRRLSTEQFTPSYMCIREEDWEEASDSSDDGTWSADTADTGYE